MVTTPNNIKGYQEMIEEVTTTSEYVLCGFQMFRMQWLSNDVDGSNKVLFHYSILSYKTLWKKHTQCVYLKCCQWTCRMRTFTLVKWGLMLRITLVSIRDVIKLQGWKIAHTQKKEPQIPIHPPSLPPPTHPHSLHPLILTPSHFPSLPPTLLPTIHLTLQVSCNTHNHSRAWLWPWDAQRPHQTCPVERIVNTSDLPQELMWPLHGFSCIEHVYMQVYAWTGIHM